MMRMEKNGRETEFKYLIAMPDTELLASLAGEIWEITQTYLRADGYTRRVRRVVCQGKASYCYTEKRRISGMAAQEAERPVSREEYERLLLEKAPVGAPIHKTRYRVPFGRRLLEFDVYPFWTDRAVLEIEVDDEKDVPALPEWVTVLRDVSDLPEYKNSSLSLRVPYDEIPAAKVGK